MMDEDRKERLANLRIALASVREQQELVREMFEKKYPKDEEKNE